MKAVHLENGTVTVRDVPEPPLPEGHARIRMLLAGICNTDLELQRGYYNFAGTPGHEFVGEVVEGPTHWLGRRVVGEINLACGACEYCLQHLTRHCLHRTVLGIRHHPGAFAETLTLPAANLHAVPDSLPSHQAVFTEPLAAACEILDQVSVPRNTPVAVLGDGKLGLLIAQVLLAAGARVHHFGRHPEKLAISARAGAVTDNDPNQRFGLVVEATGSAAGLRDAIALTKPRGSLVMKSTVHGAVPLDTAAVIVNELTLVGSRCGRFEPALRLLEQGAIDLASLTDRAYPLASTPEAFARAAERGVLKVLLH